MPKYLAILYDDPKQWEGVGPDEMQRIIEQYRAWKDQVARKGHLLRCQKLTDGEGRVMRRRQGELRILDGPFAESKEVVGGYFALQADSYEQVVKLLSDCPHLRHNGVIEVRQFDEQAGS